MIFLSKLKLNINATNDSPCRTSTRDANRYTYRKPGYASLGIPYTAVFAQAFRWNVLGIAPPRVPSTLPPSSLRRLPTLPVSRSREGCEQIPDSESVPSFFPKRRSYRRRSTGEWIKVLDGAYKTRRTRSRRVPLIFDLIKRRDCAARKL